MPLGAPAARRRSRFGPTNPRPVPSARLSRRMRPRNGVSCAFEDPDRSAFLATAFWRSDISAYVFPLEATVASSADRGSVLEMASLRCRTSTLMIPDHTRHILFTQAGRRLQLLVRDGTVGKPTRLLTEAFVEPTTLGHRILLLRRLSSLVSRKTLERALYAPDPRSRRLGLIVQALDGRLAAASYREIAIALFGARRVNADWSDPRNHLLDRVRRAVRRGKFLMRGGYLDFLR